MPDEKLPFETAREGIPATDGIPAHTNIAQSPTALGEALAAPRERRPEALATLFELFPYVSREMGGPTYYLILCKRLEEKGDAESVEIKAARQLAQVPKDKRRDDKGRLKPGLLDLVALGLTPEEVSLIKRQPMEMDPGMKLHRASIPNGEAEGNNSLSPEAITARWNRSDGGKPLSEMPRTGSTHTGGEGRPHAQDAAHASWLARAGRQAMCAGDGAGSKLWDTLESLPRTLSGRG
jgi:hypothetical protein